MTRRIIETQDDLRRDLYYKAAQAVALAVQNVGFEGPLSKDGPNFMSENPPWKRLTEDGHQERWLAAYLVGVAAVSEHLGGLADDLFVAERVYARKVATDRQLREPEKQVKRWEDKACELVALPGFKEACREVESKLKGEWRDISDCKRPNKQDVMEAIERYRPKFVGWALSAARR